MTQKNDAKENVRFFDGIRFERLHTYARGEVSVECWETAEPRLSVTHYKSAFMRSVNREYYAATEFFPTFEQAASHARNVALANAKAVLAAYSPIPDFAGVDMMPIVDSCEEGGL